MFKKMDFIIIAVLMVISFIPEIVLGLTLKNDYSAVYAEITVAGKFYKNVNLSEHNGEDTLEIKTKYGENIIKINDNKIGIIESQCPDKICMNPQYINKIGQTLVCLPNRVMIEIKGRAEEEDIILSN